ncbi:MAG: ankyrin repeat domain-containing protein [Gammaproteobacteria bacterium]|nr:ankyrin repeat domain-containing protein [Gammaproteobacteria bacterium]
MTLNVLMLLLLSISANAFDARPQLHRKSEHTQADVTQSNGKTALMLAAKDGHLERVKALLTAHADVNSANKNGGTPLMYAALGGNVEIVGMFLDRGAKIDATANNGWSALMIASAKGYTKMVDLLISRGADINSQDVYRWTPMMRAVYENRIEIVRLLLNQENIDVDRAAEKEITALHLAASQGYSDIARLLVEHGAQVNVKDAAGRTPLEIATQGAHIEVAAVLHNHGGK